MANTLILLAAESGAHSESSGTNPWIIGIGSLLLLLALLGAVVAFGGGREHS